MLTAKKRGLDSTSFKRASVRMLREEEFSPKDYLWLCKLA